jgi:hypothetical protein
LGFAKLEDGSMPRYYFDVKDGTHLADPAGLDCRDDLDAEAKARIIARQIASDAPPSIVPRHIEILDEAGKPISIVPVLR